MTKEINGRGRGNKQVKEGSEGKGGKAKLNKGMNEGD